MIQCAAGNRQAGVAGCRAAEEEIFRIGYRAAGDEADAIVGHGDGSGGLTADLQTEGVQDTTAHAQVAVTAARAGIATAKSQILFPTRAGDGQAAAAHVNGSIGTAGITNLKRR